MEQGPWSFTTGRYRSLRCIGTCKEYQPGLLTASALVHLIRPFSSSLAQSYEAAALPCGELNATQIDTTAASNPFKDARHLHRCIRRRAYPSGKLLSGEGRTLVSQSTLHHSDLVHYTTSSSSFIVCTFLPHERTFPRRFSRVTQQRQIQYDQDRALGRGVHRVGYPQQTGNDHWRRAQMSAGTLHCSGGSVESRTQLRSCGELQLGAIEAFRGCRCLEWRRW